MCLHIYEIPNRKILQCVKLMYGVNYIDFGKQKRVGENQTKKEKKDWNFKNISILLS